VDDFSNCLGRTPPKPFKDGIWFLLAISNNLAY
jgi:hypothetical protein